jgi:hypothetical protein
MSQADLATRVGVDRRQCRRCPSPRRSRAPSAISIDELAGEDTHRVDLSGDWCACWQTVKDGAEVLNPHQITMRQRGDNVWRSSPSRAYPLDEGGYELPLVPWRTPLCCFRVDSVLVGDG